MWILKIFEFLRQKCWNLLFWVLLLWIKKNFRRENSNIPYISCFSLPIFSAKIQISASESFQQNRISKTKTFASVWNFLVHIFAGIFFIFGGWKNLAGWWSWFHFGMVSIWWCLPDVTLRVSSSLLLPRCMKINTEKIVMLS